MSTTPETRRQFASRAGAFIACLAGAWAHVLLLLTVQFPPGTVVWGLPLLLAAPGIITMALTHSWKRWYRWAAILGLSFTTVPSVLAMVIVVAETWALHRSWVLERDKPLRELLAFKRAVKPEAPAAPKAERKPEPEPEEAKAA